MQGFGGFRPSSRRPPTGRTVLASLLVLSSAAAYANPQGGNVVGGAAQISAPGGATVEVVQTSPRAIIDWQSFSIGPTQTTRIRQPGSSAALLNRVVGPDASTLLGRLVANGQVVLVNPNGILIGKDATVDVGGLLATTTGIANDAFMQGRLAFDQPGEPSSFVVNQGRITATEGGLVALVAPWVANAGSIAARLGRVDLASGSVFTVDLFGDGLVQLAVDQETAIQPISADAGVEPGALVESSGRISAPGGVVRLDVATAKSLVDDVINVSGLVEAVAVEERAGRIVLRGPADGRIRVAGTLDASGRESGMDGGDIVVLGSEIRIEQTAVLQASGDRLGGTITIAGIEEAAGGLSLADQVTLVDGAVIEVGSGPQSGATVELADPDALPATGPVPADPGALQTAVDRLFVAAPLDVADAHVPFTRDVGPGRAAVLTLLAELADFAGINMIGLYDLADPANRVALFEGENGAGARRTYQLVLGQGGFQVLVDGEPAGVFGSDEPGFFIDSSGGDQGGVFFSDASLNPQGVEHLINLVADGALYDGDLAPETFQGRRQPPRTRLQAWEDQQPGDRDFNDALVNTEPRAATVVAAVNIERVPDDNGGNGNGGNGNGGNGNGGNGGNGNGAGPDPGDPDVDEKERTDSDPDLDDPATESDAVDGVEQCESWRVDQTKSDAAVARCFAALALGSLTTYGRVALASLVDALDAREPEVRAQAARDLGAVGGFVASMVPVLVEGLADPAASVRAEARAGLREIGLYASQATTELAAVARDDNVQVVRAGIEGLSGLGAYGAGALPTLAEALDHRDVGVRYYAAKGISDVDAGTRTLARVIERVQTGQGAPRELAAILAPETSTPLLLEATRVLGEVGPDAGRETMQVVSRLGGADPQTRSALYRELGALGRFSTAAVPRLVEVLASADDPALSQAVVRADAPIGTFPRGAVTAVAEGMSDPDPAVRESAVSALRTTAATTSDVVRRLETFRQDDSLAVRATVRNALEAIDDRAGRSLPVLLAALEDDDPSVRGAAAEALGYAGPRASEAVARLLASIKEDEHDVMAEAAIAVGRIGGEPEFVVPTLADALQHEDPRVRYRAAQALGYLGDRGRPATDLLEKAALGTGDLPLAYRAGTALARVDPESMASMTALDRVAREAPAAIPDLVATVLGEDEEERRRAAAGLSNIGPSAVEAVPDLVFGLGAQSGADRREVAELLKRIGGEALQDVPALVTELAGSSPARQERAARLLGRIGADAHEVVDQLALAMAHPETEVRLEAVELLALIGTYVSRATGALLAKIADPGSDVGVRESALLALREIAAVEPLRELGRSDVVMLEAPLGQAGSLLYQIDAALR